MTSPKKNKTEKRLETLSVKTKSQKEAFLGQLPKYPIVQVACEKSGVGRSTYYAWRKEDKSFAKEADEAIKSGTFFINDMAESKLIQNIQSGNNTAIIFWLKNHHKEYNERIVHEHEHNIELEDEDKKAIAKALVNIGLGNILKGYNIDPVEWHKKQERERAEHKKRVAEVLSGADSKKEEEPKKPERMVNISEMMKKIHAKREQEKKLVEEPQKRPVKKGANINDILRNRKRPDAL